MKMGILLIISILLIGTSGCSKHKSYYDIEDANNITIHNGASSYTFNSSDKEIIISISEDLNSLSFKATDKQMDPFFMFSITLRNDNSVLVAVNVDSQGVFWIDGTADCYEVNTGKFDYSYIKSLFEESSPH